MHNKKGTLGYFLCCFIADDSLSRGKNYLRDLALGQQHWLEGGSRSIGSTEDPNRETKLLPTAEARGTPLQLGGNAALSAILARLVCIQSLVHISHTKRVYKATYALPSHEAYEGSAVEVPVALSLLIHDDKAAGRGGGAVEFSTSIPVHTNVVRFFAVADCSLSELCLLIPSTTARTINGLNSTSSLKPTDSGGYRSADCQKSARQVILEAARSLADGGGCPAAESTVHIRITVSDWCAGGTLHSHLVRLRQQEAHSSMQPSPLGYVSLLPACSASQLRLASASCTTATATAGRDALVSRSDGSGLQSGWAALPPTTPSRPTSMAHQNTKAQPYGRQWQERQAALVAALQAALDIARGLAALHAAGLVHGSLGPRTILCARAAEPQSARRHSDTKLLSGLQETLQNPRQQQCQHQHQHQQQEEQQLRGESAAAGTDRAAEAPDRDTDASARAAVPSGPAPLGFLDHGASHRPQLPPPYEGAARCDTASCVMPLSCTSSVLLVSADSAMAREPAGAKPLLAAGLHPAPAPAFPHSMLARALGLPAESASGGPSAAAGRPQACLARNQPTATPPDPSKKAVLEGAVNSQLTQPRAQTLDGTSGPRGLLAGPQEGQAALGPSGPPMGSAAFRRHWHAMSASCRSLRPCRSTTAVPILPAGTAAQPPGTATVAAGTLSSGPGGCSVIAGGSTAADASDVGMATDTASPLSTAYASSCARPATTTVVTAASGPSGISGGPDSNGRLLTNMPSVISLLMEANGVPKGATVSLLSEMPKGPAGSGCYATPGSLGLGGGGGSNVAVGSCGGSTKACRGITGDWAPRTRGAGRKPYDGTRGCGPCVTVFKLLPPTGVVRTIMGRYGPIGVRDATAGAVAAVQVSADLPRNTRMWRTIAYTSPELLTGLAGSVADDGDRGCGGGGSSDGVKAGPLVSSAADLFSFGALLWQLCSGGRPPHYDKHPAQILMGLITGDLELKWPEDAGPEVSDLGRACMRRSPEERPSASQAIQVLEAVLVRLQSAMAAR